jgi:hypothetical protein
MGDEPPTFVRFKAFEGALSLIEGLTPVVRTEGETVALETAQPTALLYELTRRVRERGIDLEDLTVSRPTLEDIYLRLVAEEEPAGQ